MIIEILTKRTTLDNDYTEKGKLIKLVEKNEWLKSDVTEFVLVFVLYIQMLFIIGKWDTTILYFLEISPNLQREICVLFSTTIGVKQRYNWLRHFIK